MNNLLALLVLILMISLIFWKQIFNLYLYLFVPERVLIVGEVVKMEEIPLSSTPYEVIDFDDNFNPRNGLVLSEETSYGDYLHVVTLEPREEICIKVSHEFYLETEERFNQDDKSFSHSCYKYGYDSILRLIEPETQQISVVT